jgi:hypothetical protein
MGTTGFVVTTPLMAESCFKSAEEETINFICVYIKSTYLSM